MQVVHVIWQLCIGGGELFLRDLVASLARRGVHQQVFTVGPAGPLAPEVTALGVPVRAHRKITRAGLRTILRMAGDLRRVRPSVVHAHGEAGLVWGVPAARLAEIPAVSLMYMNYDETPIKMRAYRRLLRWPTVVVAGSKTVASFLETRLDVPRARLRVIPCGIDATRFAAEPPARTAPGPVVVSVGRLVRRKGHHVLIDAFARVLERAPAARLHVIGDGPERGALERHARERRIAHRVRFTGTCYPTASALADADLFVFPSLEEPQGLAVLEAIAAGVAVVASRTGGITEMIEDDMDGLLVAPGDVDDLSAAILRMLADAELRRRCARTARRRLAEFDAGTLTGEYLRLYEMVSASRSASSVRP